MSDSWFVASYVLLWVLVLVSFLLWIVVLRQIGVLHDRWGPRGALTTDDGPELGVPVPRFSLASVGGPDLPFPGAAPLNLAVLTNPGCSACEELAPALGTLLKDPPEGVATSVFVTDGGAEATGELVSTHGLDPARVAWAPTASRLLGVSATPMALLTDAEGRLLEKGIVNNLEQIEVLIAGGRSRETTDVVEPQGAHTLEVVSMGAMSRDGRTTGGAGQ